MAAHDKPVDKGKLSAAHKLKAAVDFKPKGMVECQLPSFSRTVLLAVFSHDLVQVSYYR